MTSPLARRTATFIVRVWAEYLAQTPPAWRGEVQVTATREMMRFQSREELIGCLERCLSDYERESGGH